MISMFVSVPTMYLYKASTRCKRTEGEKHLVVHTCAHKIEVRLVWFEGEGSPTVCVGRT